MTDKPIQQPRPPNRSRSAIISSKSCDTLRNVATHFRLVKLGHFDDVHVLFFVLHALNERFSKHQKVPTAVIDTQRRESVVVPPLERVVEGALSIGESTFTAPPEDTCGRYGCRCETEHLRLSADQPDVRFRVAAGDVDNSPIRIGPREQESEHCATGQLYLRAWTSKLTIQVQPRISGALH